MGFCVRLGAWRLTYRILSRLPFLSFPKFLYRTGIDLKPEDGYFAEVGEKGGGMSVSRANESFWPGTASPGPLGETNKLPWKEPLLFPEWPVANTSKEACNLAPGLTSKAWRNISNWGLGVVIWTLGICYQHAIKMLGLCRDNSWGHIWHAEPY